MKDKLQRIFLLSIAILFVMTSIGFGAFAVWDASRQKDTTPPTVQPSTKTLAGKPLNGFTPVTKVDSLQKIDLQAGNGKEATKDSTVVVAYTGAVASSGIVFQSSEDNGGQPLTTKLDQVIKGWTEGVPGMKVGGKRRLLIPADLAYGANPPTGSNIPANADLVFDITLLQVQ
jgi:FKBP-type peptidyl-prolyl cis-trans isomerase